MTSSEDSTTDFFGVEKDQAENDMPPNSVSYETEDVGQTFAELTRERLAPFQSEQESHGYVNNQDNKNFIQSHLNNYSSNKCSTKVGESKLHYTEHREAIFPFGYVKVDGHSGGRSIGGDRYAEVVDENKIVDDVPLVDPEAVGRRVPGGGGAVGSNERYFEHLLEDVASGKSRVKHSFADSPEFRDLEDGSGNSDLDDSGNQDGVGFIDQQYFAGIDTDRLEESESRGDGDEGSENVGDDGLRISDSEVTESCFRGHDSKSNDSNGGDMNFIDQQYFGDAVNGTLNGARVELAALDKDGQPEKSEILGEASEFKSERDSSTDSEDPFQIRYMGEHNRCASTTALAELETGIENGAGNKDYVGIGSVEHGAPSGVGATQYQQSLDKTNNGQYSEDEMAPREIPKNRKHVPSKHEDGTVGAWGAASSPSFLLGSESQRNFSPRPTVAGSAVSNQKILIRKRESTKSDAGQATLSEAEMEKQFIEKLMPPPAEKPSTLPVSSGGKQLERERKLALKKINRANKMDGAVKVRKMGSNRDPETMKSKSIIDNQMGETSEISDDQPGISTKSPRLINERIFESTNPEIALEEQKIMASLRDPVLKNAKPLTAFEFLQRAKKLDQKAVVKAAASARKISAPDDFSLQNLNRILSNIDPLHKMTNDEIIDQLCRDVLFEDEDIVIFNKPYGLDSQGGEDVKRSLGGFMAELGPRFKCDRLFLAHRLDRYSTGCIVAAKSKHSLTLYQAVSAQRNILKRYWTITKGIPNPAEGVIRIPMVETKGAGSFRMTLLPKRSYRPEENLKIRDRGRLERRQQDAETEYTVLTAGVKCALVEAVIRRGVKHQIRCHLGFAMNTPIVGDHKYSDYSSSRKPQRLPGEMLQKLGIRSSKARDLPMCLHAKQIVIQDWVEGSRPLFVEAPLPKCFRMIMSKLKLVPK